MEIESVKLNPPSQESRFPDAVETRYTGSKFVKQAGTDQPCFILRYAGDVVQVFSTHGGDALSTFSLPVDYISTVLSFVIYLKGV